MFFSYLFRRVPLRSVLFCSFLVLFIFVRKSLLHRKLNYINKIISFNTLCGSCRKLWATAAALFTLSQPGTYHVIYSLTQCEQGCSSFRKLFATYLVSSTYALFIVTGFVPRL